MVRQGANGGAKLRPTLAIIAAMIALLNGAVIYLCYLAIHQNDQSEFIIGALIGLIPTGITGLVGLGTILLNEK